MMNMNIKAIHLAQRIAQEVDISKEVFEAFVQIDREFFMPKGFSFYTHSLNALPIKAGQWISSPLTVAKMTMALHCDKSHKVLEIGCGSGYQAAILSKLVAKVYTIERIETLLKEAQERFEKLNLTNIYTKFADGTQGWEEYAPYDRILFSASCKQPPTILLDQLKDGGLLVAPIDKGGQQAITIFAKDGNRIKVKEIDECFFVPVLNGVQREQ